MSKEVFICSLVAEREQEQEQESQRANKHYEVTKADRERVTKRLYYGMGRANYKPSEKIQTQTRQEQYNLMGCY